MKFALQDYQVKFFDRELGFGNAPIELHAQVAAWSLPDGIPDLADLLLVVPLAELGADLPFIAEIDGTLKAPFAHCIAPLQLLDRANPKLKQTFAHARLLTLDFDLERAVFVLYGQPDGRCFG